MSHIFLKIAALLGRYFFLVLETRFECYPRTVLLDCSELELGRSLAERQEADQPAASR